jgi:adenylate cyclase
VCSSDLLSGYVQWRLRKPGRSRPWMDWFFPFVDMALLVAVVVLPNPFDTYPLPPPMRLGFDTILYVTLLVVLSALGQSARSVIYSTIAAVICWTAGTLYIASLPGVTFITLTDNILDMPVAERIAYLMDPWNLRLGEFLSRLILVALIGALLAVAVTRARHLVQRAVESERAHRNLSRHFSPHMAEELSRMDDAMGQVKPLKATVLFADLVGFTQLSEKMTPEQTIALLRDFHQRLAAAVFEQRGTLDKYLGDGIMASFGTPRPGDFDASSALQAARAMQRAVDNLNRQRKLLRQPPLQLAIGLHHGPVTLGNIGDENRVEYALIGETVNVAHRLEQLTRPLKARICLSDAFVEQLCAETRGDRAPLRDFQEMRPQAIRGLSERMVVWMLARTEAAEDTPATESLPFDEFEASQEGGAPPTIH